MAHVHVAPIQATLSCDVMDLWENGWQSGMRSCIMPGLATLLVQELNGSTVAVETIPINKELDDVTL